MHRCLTVEDVQRAVFREVLHKYQGKVTLARLAQTCQTFNYAALDLLWEELPSFVPLIQCLPRTLWGIHEGDKRILQFQRAMLLSDWEIIRRYSSRVRSISTLDLTSDTGLANNVISALSHPPHFGPLLPNIQKLHWGTQDTEYNPLLLVLLTSSLVDVTLPSTILQSPAILLRLAVRCPSLEKFCILSIGTSLDADNRKLLSEMIMYQHSLKSFDSGGNTLGGSAITHLSRLPTLVELSLEFQDGSELDILTPHLIPSAFASLRLLRLRTNKLSALTPLLALVHLRLHDVSVFARDLPTPNAIYLFFTALAKACDPDQLFQIDFDAGRNEASSDDRQQTILLSTLEPLSVFRNIKHFEFDVKHNIALDDDAPDTLGKRWPKLSWLSINASGRGIRSRVTHRGLITLLSHCTALTGFALAVDFTGVDSNSEVPTSRPGNGITSRCEFVDFITSEIHDPPKIAAFLSDLCPELHMVTSLWSEDEPDEELYAERWQEVERLLPIFLAVRTQCKEWYEGRRGGE